ncbi:MAG: hypothetical protein RLO81_15870 [Fulvivirga sp.]|uniref:hypothetical protein n=1 Tax=Fulvivirga sp. TaxID=1931237 RepID=UPI0032ECA0A1
MKKLKSTLVALALIVSVSAFAGGTEKTVEKARGIVSNAAPDDYKALAKAAELCVKKDVNLTEAKEWFEKSISIKENSKAFEVAGDYYANNDLHDKAIEYYVKSMLKAKENDVNADTELLESKIQKVKKAQKS